jgi:broad specificity phosphatase PhoE
MADELIVLEVVGASELPATDGWISKTADPYVIVTLDGPGGAVGPSRQSMVKVKTLAPVWRFYADYPTHGVSSPTHVVVNVWDHDVGRQDDWVCGARIALSDLAVQPTEFVVQLRRDAIEGSTAHPRTFGPRLAVRRVPAGIVSAQSPELTLFLIRHGESEWNKAQSKHNLIQMGRQVNHPLDREGVDQCRLFNDQFASALAEPVVEGTPLYDFCAADVIYASPLTRATQTCIVTLAGHPTLRGEQLRASGCLPGLTLLASAREKKNLGGQDTVGDKVGKQVLAAAAAGLQKYLSPAQYTSVIAAVGEVDTFDAATPWWTEWNDAESEENMANRYYNFLAALRYHEPPNRPLPSDRPRRIIVVGHSHFIRYFCKRYLPAAVQAADSFAGRVVNENIGNACCLAMRLAFGADGVDTAVAKAVEPLFEFCFKGEDGVGDADVVAGWARKRGGFRKNWLRRWFVYEPRLHPNLVSYYEDEHRHKKSGEIVLTADSYVQRSVAPNASPVEMEIFTQERVWRIEAVDAAGMEQWMLVFTAAAAGTNPHHAHNIHDEHCPTEE